MVKGLKMKPDLLVVLGPTASGKTRLGVQLAKELDGEIISADSRQVYRGMDIGTGKDLAEYGGIRCHLIDIVEPGYEFNVFEFQRRFLQACDDIRRRGRRPILVGGTGMYLDAVLRGYRLVEVPEDPDLRRELSAMPIDALKERLLSLSPRLHNTTDLMDPERLIRAVEIAEYEREHPPEPFPAIRSIVFGIQWDRGLLRQRITERLKVRLNEGLVEEVERLLQEGVKAETLEFYGLEYRFVVKYLKGELNRNDMFQKLNAAIHDFAKRQETWFRRMERNGVAIHWLNGSGDPFLQAMGILRH